jgi:predicted RNA-binding Zn ribbon-like protein
MARNVVDRAELMDRPAATVNLIGGRLCLDFVNSVGARRTSRRGEPVIRDEKLNDCFDLIAWAQHAGAIAPRREAPVLWKLACDRPGEARRVFRGAVKLREALHRILKSSVVRGKLDREDLATLNEWLRKARSARRITRENDRFGWTWNGPSVSLERILWLISESAAELLTTGDLSRLRQCGGDDCGWIFEDNTRNRSRHWCDSRDCGNRDRVRRFRLHRSAPVHPR